MNNQDDKEQQQDPEKALDKSDARLIADQRDRMAQAAFEAHARGEGEAVNHVPVNVEISEKNETTRERASDSQPAATQGQNDDQAQAAVRAQLQADRIPNERVMLREVKSTIRHEIDSVTKEVHRLQKAAIGYAYELTEAVDILRKLRELLADLAHRSAEYIRQLWTQITQGKSIREALI